LVISLTRDLNEVRAELTAKGVPMGPINPIRASPDRCATAAIR
jgi:hypothetical protein